MSCSCGRPLDVGDLAVPDERTIRPELVKETSVPGCGVACVPNGTSRIEVQEDWWGQLETYQRPAVVAHELGHILAGEDNRCETCADRNAGAILHAWGYSERAAAALGEVVSSRPRAGRVAVEGWRSRAAGGGKRQTSRALAGSLVTSRDLRVMTKPPPGAYLAPGSAPSRSPDRPGADTSGAPQPGSQPPLGGGDRPGLSIDREAALDLRARGADLRRELATPPASSPSSPLPLLAAAALALFLLTR